MKLDRIIAVRNNKTVYRDGSLCMKVFNSDFSKADILNEALNQALVEETALAIPKIREITVIEGKWAIVFDYIKGKTLAQIMQNDPAHKTDCLTQLVTLQTTMHTQRCPLLNRLTDKMHRRIDEAALDEALTTRLHDRLDAMPRHSCLCHGDFNPANIIIAEDGSPYILDWSHATQGNASADAARTYLLLAADGDTQAAAEYLALFCQKTGTDEAYIRQWIPTVAAAQLVKANEAERKFLTEQLHKTMQSEYNDGAMAPY